MKNPLNYEARINRVAAYIDDHLDEDIDLNQLAEVACMSPYHWHRVYVGMRGETVATTVKRLRMNRASVLLLNSDLSVEKVACSCGYPNLQSFSRIFKAVYGLPPATYRREGLHRIFDSPSMIGENIMYKVAVKKVADQTAITLDHKGSYLEIHRAFDRLCGWLANRGLLSKESQLIGIYYDDPDSVAEEQLRSKAGVITGVEAELEAPIGKTLVAAGRYAVLEQTGPYAELFKAYRWLFGSWLAESDEELGDRPAFEMYMNDPQTTPPAQLRTDIYMPLQ